MIWVDKQDRNRQSRAAGLCCCWRCMKERDEARVTPIPSVFLPCYIGLSLFRGQSSRPPVVALHGLKPLQYLLDHPDIRPD
jgi:hypothetical protein